ncbi:unnamed protein product [Durusdinium trenchii]|uniref:Sacsin/Nov domain-containing protein n=1 Tax=Durusdinium trenchii TaxID=1381693 RepID=A0ABP0SXX0_9DINO
MASWLRSCASALRRLPRRGIEEFWQGGVRDPLINAAQKQEWAKSGDPWPAVLLRQKSFEDMHKLWYVLLKEKNFLLAEQHEARQNRVRWKHHGRLKKVKLSMKRILTVLTRREIHQQVLRSKEMLLQQTQREELETQRFQLEESMKGLRWKIRRAEPRDSMATQAWKATLQKYEADHERLLRELVPLRRDTMQLLSPDWRFARKYSDLPGAINWKRPREPGETKQNRKEPEELCGELGGWGSHSGKYSWKFQGVGVTRRQIGKVGEESFALVDWSDDLVQILRMRWKSSVPKILIEGKNLQKKQLLMRGTNETALILERLILTTGFGQTDKPAVEQLLLRVRSVKQVRAPARRVLTASLNSANVPLPPANPMLRMLNGRLSLYEALTARGSQLLPALFGSVLNGPGTVEPPRSLVTGTQIGSAGLRVRPTLRFIKERGGRLPAHLASSAGTHMALQLLVRLLQLAPATLLIEDDEGATPLGLLARAPLLQKALTCAAALPQQTTRLLQQSPEAARAWRVLASAGGGRAALLLAPERMDESLEDLTWQAEEREGQAAARLRQGLQRIMVLQSIASVSEQKIDALEPQELRLRLAHLEKVAQQQREEASAASALLEAENRQLKRSLADKEEADAKLGHFESHERAVIEDIRKAPASRYPTITGGQDLRRGVLEMRRSLTAAVDRLARDLYESQAHFLQELLQNADDNNYTEGILPKLDLVLRGRPPDSHLAPYFFAANNEVGLTEVDVRALCDISRSSKTQAGTTTGYKGVGWKSVFRVCETPHVLSQKWRFRFSSSGLGMLTPTWLSEEDLRRLPSEVLDAHQRGETVFYLPLADPGSSLPSIRTEMQTMEADFAQLLFLRRVMQISLRGDFTANAGDSMVVMSAQLSHTGLRTSTSCQVFKKEEHSYGLESEQTTSFEVNSHEDVVVALPLVA